MRINGTSLARKWGLIVKQARYRESGDWYAPLTAYPGALLDPNGYILIADEANLRNHKGIKVTEQIHIPLRISTLFDYVRVAGLFPEEITEATKVPEGASVAVNVNRYERNTSARKTCLEHYGFICSVCGHSMVEIYGPLASHLIHVHHLVPLSDIGEKYLLDPIADLRPVCPNCHAFLHITTPPQSVEKLRIELKEKQNGTR